MHVLVILVHTDKLLSRKTISFYIPVNTVCVKVLVSLPKFLLLSFKIFAILIGENGISTLYAFISLNKAQYLIFFGHLSLVVACL